MTIDHNLIHPFKEFEGETRGDNSIEADPGFVDITGGNFRLRPGSPAVDSGSLEGAPAEDIEGVQRPQGGIVDMGAYEIQ